MIRSHVKETGRKGPTCGENNGEVMLLLSLVFIYLALCECWGSYCLGFLHPQWAPRSCDILLTFLVPIFVYKARSCKREAFGNPMPPLPSFIFPSLASYCSIPFEITTRFPCYHNSLSFLSFLDLFSNPPCNGLVNCACLSPSLKGLEDLFGNHHKKNTKACLLKFRMKVGLHFRNAMMWEHLISDDQECCSVVLCGYGRVNINVI